MMPAASSRDDGRDEGGPDIESLIPHRAPMLLVERLVECFDDGVVCQGRIPEDGPLSDGGVASVFLALELGAQAAAVHEALGRGDGNDETPRMGYLASVRGAFFNVAQLPAGQPLRATARRIGGVAPLAMYAVDVRLADDGSELASATLATYQAA